MSSRHAPFIDSFNDRVWPVTDTRPHKQSWTARGPGRPSDSDYRRDYAKFSELNSRRNSFIRISSNQVEPLPTGWWDTTGIPPLPIWVVVFQVAPGWHFELPFFRGPKPFEFEPSTDAEVAAIVSECVAIGGYDNRALQAWRAAVAAKQ